VSRNSIEEMVPFSFTAYPTLPGFAGDAIEMYVQPGFPHGDDVAHYPSILSLTCWPWCVHTCIRLISIKKLQFGYFLPLPLHSDLSSVGAILPLDRCRSASCTDASEIHLFLSCPGSNRGQRVKSWYMYIFFSSVPHLHEVRSRGIRPIPILKSYVACSRMDSLQGRRRKGQ